MIIKCTNHVENDTRGKNDSGKRWHKTDGHRKNAPYISGDKKIHLYMP